MEDPILLGYLDAWHKLVDCMEPTQKRRALESMPSQINVIRFAHEMEVWSQHPRVKTVNNATRRSQENVIVPQPFQGVELVIPIILGSGTHETGVSNTYSIARPHPDGSFFPPSTLWGLKGMGYIPDEMVHFISKIFSRKLEGHVEEFKEEMRKAEENLAETLLVYHERNDRTLRKHAATRMGSYITKCNMQDLDIDILMAVIRAVKSGAGDFENFARYLSSNVQDLHLLSQEDILDIQRKCLVESVYKE